MAINEKVGNTPLRMLKSGNGRAAVEVDSASASLAAGDNHVQVYGGSGIGDPGSISFSAPAVGFIVPPTSIKIFGIWAFNPMAFVPGAPTFLLIPPAQGTAAMGAATAMYASMLATLSAGVAGSMAAGAAG